MEAYDWNQSSDDLISILRYFCLFLIVEGFFYRKRVFYHLVIFLVVEENA